MALLRNPVGCITVLGLVACFAAMAPTAVAQGSMSLSNQPPNNGGTSAGANSGCSFDVVCTGAFPLRIYRIGCATTAAGTFTVEVRYRIGGFSQVYPVTGAIDLALSDWVLAGSAPVTMASSLTLTQVPVDLNLVIPAGQRVGFSVRALSANISYQTATAGVQVSDANLTLMYGGIAGPAGNLGTGGPGFTANNYPRGAIAGVWYDHHNYSGTHTAVDHVQVNNGGPMVVGVNTVQARIANRGTTSLDNVPLGAEYSTDGGQTWTGFQTFQFPSFPVLTMSTVTFAQILNLTGLARVALVVRLASPSPIGQGEPSLRRDYVPDLDVESVTTVPSAVTLGAPFQVKAVLRNNGGFNLNGLTLGVRYTLNGAFPVSQSFVPSTLPAASSTEEVTFTAQASVTAPGTYALGVEPFPAIPGDPDQPDRTSTTLENVGVPFKQYAPSAGVAGGGTPPIARVSSTASTPGTMSVYQFIYSAPELSGLPSGALVNNLSFFKANDHRTVAGKGHRLKVWLENTTATAFAGSATYANFSATGTLVHDVGDFAFPPVQGWMPVGPFNQSPPFFYSGGSIIVSVEWDAGGDSAPVTVTGPSGSATQLQWQCEPVTAPNSGRGYYNSVIAPTDNLNLGAYSSATRRPHARFFHSPPSVPIIVDRVLPDAFEGQSYSHALQAQAGGSGPYVWAVTAGALPPGLVLNASGGALSGTPAAASASPTPYGFVLSCTDASGTSHRALSILVTPLTVVTPAGALPEGNAGFPYVGGMSVIGGTGNYTFSLDSGNLPVGLTLNVTTGALTGICPVHTISSVPVEFVLKVTDGNQTLTRAYSITVVSPSFLLLPGAPETTDGIYTGWPFNTGWHDHRLQTIYLASELAAAGLYAGAPLTGLRLRVAELPGLDLVDVRIRIMHTALTECPGDFINTGLTLCHGPVTVPLSALSLHGWFAFQLSTPFTWNGTDNLLFEFTTDGTAASGFGGCYTRVAGTNRSSFRYQNSPSPWPFATGWQYPTRTAVVPTMRIEFPPLAQVDLDVDSVTFGPSAGPSPALGSNQVNVKIRSEGAIAYTGQLGIQYSADGGTTWVSNAAVSPTALTGIGTWQVFPLSTPWVISAPIGPRSLKVRIHPTVQGDPDPADEATFSFTVDLDITALTASTFVGSNAVAVSLTNNGTMSLAGVSADIQLSTDGGTTFGPSQSVSLGSLVQFGSVMTVTLSQAWTVSAVGNYTLVARIAQQLPGDPDTADSLGRLFQGVGAFEAMTGLTESSNGVGDGFPFSSTHHDMRMEALYTRPDLEGAGLVPGISILGIQLKAAQPPGMSLEGVRIRLGTTLSWVQPSQFGANSLTDVFGPATLSMSGTPPAISSGQWVTFQFVSPFQWNGYSHIVMDYSQDGSALAPGGGCFMRYPSSFSARHLKGYANSTHTFPFNAMNIGGTGNGVPSIRFILAAPADPGMSVRRAGNPVIPTEIDGLGNQLAAGAAQNRTWDIGNTGLHLPLNVSGVSVLSQTNVSVQVVASPVGTPVLPQQTAALTLAITPGTGSYSFQVQLQTNSAIPSQAPFLFTVSGLGVQNNLPTVYFRPDEAVDWFKVTGTPPNLSLRLPTGHGVGYDIATNDLDSPGQQVTLSLAVAQDPGTLPLTAVGFQGTLPVTVGPSSNSPYVPFTGVTGSVPGTVNLVATATDTSPVPGVTNANLQIRLQNFLDLTYYTFYSPFERLNGNREIHRGESGYELYMRVSNPNAFAVGIGALECEVRHYTGNLLLTGYSFALVNGPVTVPANAQNHVVRATMSISPGATGTHGARLKIKVLGATLTDQSNPSNELFLKTPSNYGGGFDQAILFDGPPPAPPLTIVQAPAHPMVETYFHSRHFTALNGVGNYSWSVPGSSQSLLPAGIAGAMQGTGNSEYVISGMPAVGTSSGSPYNVTVQVNDGTWVRRTVVPMTVYPSTPLQITTSSLLPAMELQPYLSAVPVEATGGSRVYTFSVDPSSPDPLPAGLSLDPNTGMLSGAPSAGTQGIKSIRFGVYDGQDVATSLVSLLVQHAPLAWTAATIPDAVQTAAYSQMLPVQGGLLPVIFGLSSGALPSGLSLNASTGVISGTPGHNPPTMGSYNLVFSATDAGNTSVSQPITLVVLPAGPISLVHRILPPAEVGIPYSAALNIGGGSGSYTVSLAPSSPPLPAGMALSSSGLFIGTPLSGSDGRYVVGINVDDGHQTHADTVIVPVLANGVGAVRIVEVDSGTGYIELSNTGPMGADLSGCRIRLWIGSTFPLALPFDTLPGGSLALGGETLLYHSGASIAGNWPQFYSGAAWPLSPSSDVAVQLLDIHGNTVDFAAFGTVPLESLVDGTSSPLELPPGLSGQVPNANGSANYSFDGTAWVASPMGTPGTYNPGLSPVALGFAKAGIRTAASGTPFEDFVLAHGGRSPYLYSLDMPAAPYLSVSAATGTVSGVVPAVSTPVVVNGTLTVTDAELSVATAALSFYMVPSAASPQVEFTVSQVSGQRHEGTEVDVPVTMVRSSLVTDVASFGFAIQLPTPTGNVLGLVRVVPGPAAVAAGISVSARNVGGGRFFIQSVQLTGSVPPSLGDGVVAIIRLRVPLDDNVMAPEGTYPLHIQDVGVVRNSSEASLAAGYGGSVTLANYRPEDANRDYGIDVVDVQLIVNIILQMHAPEYPRQGDANLDSAVDVVDVQRTVNCILLGGCE